MKAIAFSLFLVILSAPAFNQANQRPASDSSNLSVMTYNIRYKNPGDGEYAWPNRKEMVIELIQDHAPDILCLQEALLDQVEDIKNELKGYGWYGVGRDDGEKRGEYAAIFYKDSLFHIVDSGTFWLSETPDIPGSMGWDAACTRVATWVKLNDLQTGKTFYVFNTHFDHRGVIARKYSAMLLLKKVGEITGKSPIIVAGDFNCDESSDVYEILVHESSPYNKPLNNSRIIAEERSGPPYTFVGFDFIGVPGDIIDHIFIDSSFLANCHIIVTDNEDGIYPSDHLPVLVEVKF